jgi:CS domain-containing protein
VLGELSRALLVKVDLTRRHRNDFYQTTESVIASLYLKKIDASKSRIEFTSPKTLDLDLRTSDNKRYTAEWPLFGEIIPEKSKFKIMGTKLELTFAKSDASGWPVLRSTDPLTGQIIQSGRPGTMK